MEAYLRAEFNPMHMANTHSILWSQSYLELAREKNVGHTNMLNLIITHNSKRLNGLQGLKPGSMGF